MAEKELKIGAEIKIEDETFIVKEGNFCGHCSFYLACRNHLFQEVNNKVGLCSSAKRKDKTDVIFVKVEN